jgi:hypothetical protein
LIDIELFDKIILKDLLENIFLNTKKHGKIEPLEVEKKKEIVLNSR